MRSVRLISILVLLFLQWTTSAQWRGPQLTRLGPAEGLPTSIFDIAQDSTGYLYLAGNAGMYRYDGNRFEFFGHDPLNASSIGPGDVYSVYAARDGLIWLTLRFGGLNSFDPQTGDFKRYPLPESSGSNPGANAIYEDDEGTLWVGGSLFRLMNFDRSKGTFTTYTPDWIDPTSDTRRLAILSILPDKRNPQLLWLSVLDYRSDEALLGSYGLVSFDTHTKQFQDHPCSGLTRHIDNHGTLWGTYWGNWICSYDPATQECDTTHFQFIYDDKIVTPLSQDITIYQGLFLVSTSLALLNYNSNGSFDVIAQPSSYYESFQSLFNDRSDNLWIAARQGAYVLNPDDQHIRFFSLSQFGVEVRLYPGRLAYLADADVMYFAHPNTPQFRQIYEIPLAENQKAEAAFINTDFHVQTLACDYRQRIWVSGNGALNLLNPSTKQVTRTDLISSEDKPLPGLMKMSAHPNGWMGAYSRNEFIWFHADSQSVHRLNLEQLSEGISTDGSSLVGFTFGKNDNAYVFSDKVYLVDLMNGTVQNLKHDGYFNPNHQDIQYVGEDAEGNIWMSSFMLVGKYRLDGDSLVMQDAFTIDDGMISPTSIELHFDDHHRVWAFTISGMNCIDPVTREVRFFGIKEGLPDSWIDPVQVLTVSDSRIATHCANGLIVFDPEALWNSVTPSSEQVVITQIRISGEPFISEKSINSLDTLELKPGHGVVDVEFQGLAYPTDDRIEYSYRITGLQNNWLALGKNKLVTLPALSPGDYVFEVKTGKPHDKSQVKSLTIVVGTPIYLRWWFIVLVLSILVSGIVAIMQWRIRRIQKQQEALTEVNKKIAELELKALRSQMNPHFMFNSLNSIKNFILHSEPTLAAEYLSNFAHLIRLILQNSREKSISLQEELETLVLYIELERLRFDEEFDFKYVVDEDVHLEYIRIPPMLLQPYVENAIWHGLMHKKERGHLLLQFSKQGDKVACVIEDDGVGRESAQKMKSLSATRYKSMGMGITQDRIEIMNKMDALGISTEITDKHDASGKPSGTRVILCIPYSNELYT